MKQSAPLHHRLFIRLKWATRNFRKRLREEFHRRGSHAAGLISRIAERLPHDNRVYFALIVVTGVFGSVGAMAFRGALSLFQGIYLGTFAPILEAAQRLPWSLRILAPPGGAFLAGLILHYGLKGVRGEGIAEIMEAVSLKGGALKLRRVLTKSLSTVFLIGSGGSAGREGPIVQIGAAAAAELSDRLRVSWERRRILIGCGVAAGMAAAYNAPIGASFFVMEIIIGNFAMDIFGPLVLASVVSTLITRATLGGGPIYQIPQFRMETPWEGIPYFFLGIAAGLIALAFRESLRCTELLFKRLALPTYGKVVLGGVAVGAMSIAFPHVWGNGYEAVSLTLNGVLSPSFVAMLLLMKIAATSATVGSGGSGGIFTPTLFVGAALGSTFGYLVHQVWSAAATNPNAYALVGMAGLLAGVTHAPITAALIVFEMSQNYGMIVPLMVTSALGSLTARRFKADSLYAEKVRQRGIDIDVELEGATLRAIQVRDVLQRQVPTISPETRLPDIFRRFLAIRSDYLYVVDRQGRLIGVINLHDVKDLLNARHSANLIIAYDLAQKVPMITPEESLSEVLEQFWAQEVGHLPVVQSLEEPVLLGIVSRRDVIGAFDREVLKRKLLGTRMVRGKTGQAKIEDYQQGERQSTPGTNQ